MKRYIVFNNGESFIIHETSLFDAKMKAVNFCDCSHPITVKELTEVKL